MKTLILGFVFFMGILFNGISQTTFSDQIVISVDADGANCVYVADLDNDGDIDVLSSSSGDDKVAWYENDGSGLFISQHIISIDEDSPHNVYAADLDNDGDLDVLSATWDNSIMWYENGGNGDFVSQYVITTDVIGGMRVYATDLDNDGDMDVLSASIGDDKIAWYENLGNGSFDSQNIISSNVGQATSVYAADLDNDGDMDVLSASHSSSQIAWYKNNGNGNFGSQQIIATNAHGAFCVYSADIDNDGDMDVLSASIDDNKIALYENYGDGNFVSQQIISDDAVGARSVYAADLDNDGDLDVLSASAEDGKIAWYENDGLGNFGNQQIISTIAYWANSVYAADIDKDGDVDVLSASNEDDKIAWYKNNMISYTPPTNQFVCENTSAKFTIGGTDIVSYQWQVKTGDSFEDLSDGDIYSGTTTEELSISNVTQDMNGFIFRCVITFTNAVIIESSEASLTVLASPITDNIVGNPNPAPYETYTYTVSPTSGSTYDWTVEGGGILNANNNNVDILWGEDGYGSLSVIETASNGCVGTPSELQIIIDVQEIANKYNIQIFPNPSKGELYISGDKIHSIEIFNTDGKSVRRVIDQAGNIRLDLSQYARGVYFIKFESENGDFTRKIILK